MSEKYVITRRHAGLGDLLCNLQAAHWFAETFNRSVIIDWRQTPYNNKVEHKINLFHSLYKIPKKIGNVKYYSFEEIPEVYSFSELDKWPKITIDSTTQEVEHIMNQPECVAIELRAFEINKSYPILADEMFIQKTYRSFWENFKIKKRVLNKINYYKKIYFEPWENKNVIGIHIRHGNGEARGGYNESWYNFKEVKEKIDKVIVSSEHIPQKSFFICSDNKQCTLDLLNYLPNSFTTIKTYVPDDNGPLHMHSINPIDSIQEAFIDMELLSLCKVGIFTKFSVFTLKPSINIDEVWNLDKKEVIKVKERQYYL